MAGSGLRWAGLPDMWRCGVCPMPGCHSLPANPEQSFSTRQCLPRLLSMPWATPSDGHRFSMQDAQNAAATRALFELAAGDASLQDAASPLLLQLPPAFQELWLQWEEEGEDEEAAAAAAAETEEALAARKAFVQQLLSRAAAQQGAAQQAAGWEKAAAANGQPAGWQQELLSAIAAAKGGPEAQQQQTAAQQRDSERLMQEQQAWRESGEGQKWLGERAK